MGEKKMPNDGNETFDMEHLLELAKEKKYRLLKEELVELNEVDIASFIEELDSERTVIVFRMLPKALATEVFAELPVDKQSHIINSITDKELSEIVEELYVDDAVDLVEELPATVVRRVLQNTKPETRKLINQFLNYPENTAGSIMTAEYVGLKKNYDGGTVFRLYPSSRGGFGDDLHLLCDGRKANAGRRCDGEGSSPSAL